MRCVAFEYPSFCRYLMRSGCPPDTAMSNTVLGLFLGGVGLPRSRGSCNFFFHLKRASRLLTCSVTSYPTLPHLKFPYPYQVSEYFYGFSLTSSQLSLPSIFTRNNTDLPRPSTRSRQCTRNPRIMTPDLRGRPNSTNSPARFLRIWDAIEASQGQCWSVCS